MSQNTKNLGEKLFECHREMTDSYFDWVLASATEKQSAQTRRNVARRNLELVRSELLNEGLNYSVDRSIQNYG